MLSMQLRLGGIYKSSRIDRPTIPLFLLDQPVRPFEADNQRVELRFRRHGLQGFHFRNEIGKRECLIWSWLEHCLHHIISQTLDRSSIVSNPFTNKFGNSAASILSRDWHPLGD